MRLLLNRRRFGRADVRSPGEPTKFAGRIADGSHDSEEVLDPADQSVFPNSTDLELGHDNDRGAQAVGLLWEGTGIRSGDPVNTAAIQFVSNEPSQSGDCMVRIWCEDADAPAAFTDTVEDISGRTKTTAFVDWDIPAWATDGQEDADTTTPDLSGPVQEVVNREGFSGDVAFIIETSPNNTGADPRRAAKSRDLTSTGAPLLTINGGEEAGGGSGDPIETEYGLLGDESFDRLDLDNSASDANGLTLRDWYDKLLSGGTAGTYDWAFDRADNRPANRQGAMYVTSLILGLRMLGDLKLLDEAVRLTELWYSHLTTDGSGFLHHDDDSHDQALDVRLSSGLFARVMGALDANRALTSPAGHAYGTIADKYKAYLVDDYFPRWRGIEGTHLTEGIDHDSATSRHSFAGTLASLYYVWQMGGGGGFTEAQWESEFNDAADLYFSLEEVCSDGHDGRNVLVFPMTVSGDVSNTNAQGLMYTTYIRYVVSFTMDLWMEGVDSRFNETWWERFSHSIADLVIDTDAPWSSEEIARTIGGDSPSGDDRCGVPYVHDYRTRLGDTDKRWQDSGFALLEGFDSRGRVIDFGTQMYSNVSQSFADDYPNFPCARIFTRIHFGW